MFHFKLSKYSIWQLTYFVTGIENILLLHQYLFHFTTFFSINFAPLLHFYAINPPNARCNSFAHAVDPL